MTRNFLHFLSVLKWWFVLLGSKFALLMLRYCSRDVYRSFNKSSSTSNRIQKRIGMQSMISSLRLWTWSTPFQIRCKRNQWPSHHIVMACCSNWWSILQKKKIWWPGNQCSLYLVTYKSTQTELQYNFQRNWSSSASRIWSSQNQTLRILVSVRKPTIFKTMVWQLIIGSLYAPMRAGLLVSWLSLVLTRVREQGNWVRFSSLTIWLLCVGSWTSLHSRNLINHLHRMQPVVLVGSY